MRAYQPSVRVVCKIDTSDCIGSAEFANLTTQAWAVTTNLDQASTADEVPVGASWIGATHTLSCQASILSSYPQTLQCYLGVQCSQISCRIDARFSLCSNYSS